MYHVGSMRGEIKQWREDSIKWERAARAREERALEMEEEAVRKKHNGRRERGRCCGGSDRRGGGKRRLEDECSICGRIGWEK